MPCKLDDTINTTSSRYPQETFFYTLFLELKYFQRDTRRSDWRQFALLATAVPASSHVRIVIEMIVMIRMILIMVIMG